MNCVKSLFDLQKDSSLLSSIVGKSFRKKSLEGNYLPVSDVYAEIKEQLLKQDNFVFQYEQGMNTTRFKNALRLMYKTIVDSATIAINRRNKTNPNEELSAFVTELDNNFVGDAGITDNDVIIHEESIPDIKGAGLEGEEERRNRKLDSIIEEFYSTSVGAIEYRERKFNENLLRNIIINTDTRELVSNNDDLNRQIVRMKNGYLSTIVSYLRSIEKADDLSDQMFNESGSLIPSYINALNRMYNIIKKQGSQELANSIDQGWKDTISGKESLFFDAVNAYVNLVYFDDLMKDAIGKTVEIDSKYDGFEVDAIYPKYTFSHGDEHKRKGWEVDSSRSAFDNIAKFSKLVIGIIPMKSNRNGKYSGRNVNIVSFSNAMTTLFRVASNLPSNFNYFKQTLYKFHSNPSLYSQQLLDYIVNERIAGIKDSLLINGMTEFDMDVLYSVFNFVYDTDNPSSVKSIETDSMKRKFSVGRYSIVDSINGVMDRVMDASYLQTTYDDNGGAYTTIKKKYSNRRVQYSIMQNINSLSIKRGQSIRKKLVENYPISRKGNNTQNYTIIIGGQAYTLESKSSKGVLGHQTTKLTGPSAYGKIFNRVSASVDLSDNATISRILNDSNLSGYEKQFKDVLQFIDQFLYTNFLTEDGLRQLYLYKSISSDANYINSLLTNAIKAAIINDLYYNFKEQVGEGNPYSSQLEFTKFLETAYSPFKGILRGEEAKDYFTTNYNIKDVIVVSEDETWVDRVADVRAILSGEISKAVTKDLQGNSIANYRTSFLGGNIQYYLAKSRGTSQNMKELNPALVTASEALLFTSRNDLIKSMVMNNDVQSRGGIKKSIKDMKTGELYYTSIFHNFYGTFLGDPKGKDKDNNLKGTFIIQPTTYSDKTTFINYAIDGTKKFVAPGKSYHDKSLAEMNNQQLTDLYRDTIGQAYKNLLTNVLQDYQKLFGENLTIEEINNRLNNLTESQIIQLGKERGVSLQLDTHYRVNKATKKLKFNELLQYYATNLYNKKGVLENRMKLEEVNFLNDLLDSNVSFYTRYYDDGERSRSNNPIARVINSGKFMTPEETEDFKNKWIHNDKLILAKVDGKDIMFGSRIKGYNKSFELNPLLAKYFYTDSLLSNNLRFSLTGSEVAHPDKAIIDWKSELEAVGLETYPPFLDKNGKINKAKLSDLTNLYDILKRHNNMDLDAGEAVMIDKLETLYNSVIRKTEAAAQGTQLKRNVIIPATLQYVQQNVMNGVPSKIKVAVIRDLKADVFNFRGDTGDVDAHDGSAWINPFISILENKSLQDQEVGVDKKPIWHHFDERLMSATLLKFATFTMTNERMLQSMNSDLSLYKLFKKMTNQQWSENGVWTNSKGATIDLVKGKGFGNKNINFSRDILQDKPLFYNENGKHYQITDLKSDANGYYTLETEVNLNGNPLDSSNVLKVYHFFDQNGTHFKVLEDQLANRDQSLHSINSLYELHKTLGGIYSESLNDDGDLKYSEASNYAVVNYVNNVSTRVTNDTSDLSQNTYYQPLKEMMISYAANNSAVKNGASNINQSRAWYGNDDLTYMEIDSDGLGIQMDADHEIDEAEMTEFSQVISSLEAGGRLHHLSKQVYKDLGEVAIQSSKIEVDAVAKYLSKQTGNTPVDQVLTDLYDVIGRTIINNYKRDPNKAELATEIITEITKKFNLKDNHIADEFKIPFSDVNIYNNILPTFISTINNKSIKRKYPGSGCVMVPGFKIIQNFKIKGQNYSFNDLMSRAKASNQVNNFYPQFVNGEDYEIYSSNLVKAYLLYLQDQEAVVSTPDQFIPTDVANVIFTDDSGVVHEVPISLERPDIYYALKSADKVLIAKHILKDGLVDLQGQKVMSIAGITKQIVDGKEVYIQSDPNLQFQCRTNVTLPRSLQPARITWKYRVKEGEQEIEKMMNIFDLEPIKNSFNGIVDRKAIQKAFDDLDKGIFYINGVQYQAYDIQNEAAELVMSNLYASKFNTQGASLADILETGKDFFRKRQKPLVSSNHYDAAFTKGNNRNLYITFQEVESDIENGFNPKYKGWNYIKREGNKVYAITKDNRILFEVGRDIPRDDLFYDESRNKYFDSEGNEVDDQNLRLGDDNKVLEYVEFISNYTISEKHRTGKINQFQLYKIDREKIKKVLVNNNPETFEKDVNYFISGKLSEIYKTDSYKGIQVNNTLPTSSAQLLTQILPHMQVDDTTKELILETNRILYPSMKSESDVYKVDTKAYKNILNEHNNKFLDEIYSSFQKSLYFTASRIPAQTLQSFMQMKLTGFTQSSKNIVYVSHWQTWLQGSDYDIDKAYIMGFEFDDNGKYVGWSDLFEYSTIEHLRASEYLPTPTKINYYNAESGVDITSYMQRILTSENQPQKIRVYAELLTMLGNLSPEVDNLGNKKLAVKWDYNVVNKDLGQIIVKRLNKHEFTSLSPLMIESAYKNSVSSKIQNIVQDLRNMDAAYSPIEMEGIRDASKNSPKGSLASNMTLMNPLTKFSMQVQNMVGKGVIGITAVGEKVFFNTSYYWNEGIRSGDEKWINNLKFSQTFNRIQGRASGNIVPSNKTVLANVNFENYDLMRFRFSFLAGMNDKLRQQYGITDEDVEQKTEKWQQYHDALLNEVKAQQDIENSADLQISELLSAATDNAKELILAKINAGTNLARMYLHLIMMGFQIGDIVQFMISPAVSLINDLSEANMFDEYVNQMRVQDAANILRGAINPNQFFQGSTVGDEGQIVSNAQGAFSFVNKALRGKLEMVLDKNDNLVPKKYTNFNDLISAFINMKISDPLKQDTLMEMISQYSKNPSPAVKRGLNNLSDYIENIVSKIRAGIDQMEVPIEPSDTGIDIYNRKKDQFYLDLDEFDKVWDLSTETSILGSGFLGLNQGLPTSKQDLMGKLRTLENAVSAREKVFGIDTEQFVIKDTDSQQVKTKKMDFLQALLTQLQANNPLLDPTYIEESFSTAQDAGIINNFNIETWLMDDYTALPDGRVLRYRDIVSDYYNIIKGTWNIFDMIEKIPHYNSIFKLLRTVYITDSAISKKSNIVNLIQREIMNESGYLDDQQTRQLLKYVDDLLIVDWLRNSDIKFPVLQGWEYFNRYVDRITSSRDASIDLSTSEGRASFKLLMESEIVPSLRSGFYSDTKGGELINLIKDKDGNAITDIKLIKDNEFIRGLMDSSDNGVPFLKLDIDMMNINSTPASSIKFQSYLDGLYKLKNYYLYGRPLSDWFMIYNIIVNQNRYGSDRLTTIFKPFIGLVKEGSIIKKYFQKVGELDYFQSEQDLEDIGFNIEDAFIRMAPFVSKYAEKQAKSRYIKQSNSQGGIIYKRRQPDGSYKEVPVLPRKVLTGDGDIETRSRRQRDFQEYWTIQTPTYDSNMVVRTNLSSQNIDELVQALVQYTANGVLKIYKQNC